MDDEQAPGPAPSEPVESAAGKKGAAVTNSGNPDSFPALEVAGRTFSNGEGSTAVVTVAADGSGSLQATGLVELASIQVSSPDPDARIDLSMQWTCQEEK